MKEKKKIMMNQLQFEQLSKKIMEKALDCKDEHELFKIVCGLLNAKVTVLLHYVDSESSQRYEIKSVYPESYRSFMEANIDILRGWYDIESLPPAAHGFTKEEAFKVGNEIFPSALVAFSRLSNATNEKPHELILLKSKETKKDSSYSSYHCWAAAVLLRHYEYFLNVKNLLRKEEDIKVLNRSLENGTRRMNQLTLDIDEMLLNQSCESLLKTTKKLNKNAVKAERYIIWTGYHVRKRYAGEGQENIECVSEEIKKVDGQDSIYDLSIKFLQGKLDKAQWNDFIEKLSEKTSSNYSELKKIVAIILEHGWRTIRDEALSSKEELVDRRSFKNLFDDLVRITKNQSNLNIKEIEKIINEHKQSKTQDANQTWDSIQNESPEIGHLIDKVNPLMKLTKSLLAYAISSENNEQSSGENVKEIGRGFLRLYLALQIVGGAPELKRRYLDNSKSKNSFKAPPELQRAYVINLARFILSALSIMQKQQLRMKAKPLVITPAEDLDSLLYMVDRYIHIELGVEETLHIQELLSNQTETEIRHHIKSSFYRDHLLHVIDVFILGHLFLNTHVRWTGNEKKSLVDQLSVVNDSLRGVNRETWMKNWAVAALFHDIGYQIGQGENISQEHEVWKNFFSLKKPISLGWLNFTIDKNENQIQLDERTDWLLNMATETVNQEKFAKCFPNDLSKNITDHGVMSALRVSQLLLNSKTKTTDPNEFDDCNKNDDYQLAIHAISHHNIHGDKVNFTSHPLSCLLRLCDELQEWNRKRVNNEKVVKNLYLDIQYNKSDKLTGYEMFKSFKANLKFKVGKNNNGENGVKVSLGAEQDKDVKPWFRFDLIYRDAIEADFIPMMTLLSKAYNLQHIDLSGTYFGHGDLKFSMDMFFPRPSQFDWLTEYDIFGLFTELERRVSLLEHFETINNAEPGLVHLSKNTEEDKGDRFGLILSRSSDPVHRKGWLSVNPDYFFRDFKDFRYDYLAGKRLYIKSRRD